MTDTRMHKLYRQRAEFAEMERDLDDKMKYVRVGGLPWRVFGWLLRATREYRLDVQAEIDELNETERKIQ